MRPRRRRLDARRLGRRLARFLEHVAMARSDRLYRLILSREYRRLMRVLGFRGAFMYTFYLLLYMRRALPWFARRAIIDALRGLAREAARERLERLLPRLERTSGRSVRMPLVDMSYSDLADLAALARLAWLADDVSRAPYPATLARHIYCASSRIFIRWTGERGYARWYLAYHVDKDDRAAAAMPTPDDETLTMPMVSAWAVKYGEDWTTVLESMLDRLLDMASQRGAYAWDGRRERAYTMPIVLLAYTGRWIEQRFIIIGLSEEADTARHCSLYYMPSEERSLKRTRPHRVYEAKAAWRRWRRMEGWL